MSKSPYLEYELRLQDVMTAIQFMGTHNFEKLSLAEWTKKIGPPKSVKEPKTWADVFSDHPEFFHVERNEEEGSKLYYSLQWRRAYERNYDPNINKELTRAERHALPSTDKELVFSRKPLTSEQIGTLLQTAINLDTRAHAFDERRRWLVSTLLPFIGGILGALLGALLK